MDPATTEPGIRQLLWRSAEPFWFAFRSVLESPLRPESRVYWLFLLSSLAIALGIYLRIRSRKGGSKDSPSGMLGGFVNFCFPSSIWQTSSAWLDVRYFFFHRTVMTILTPIVSTATFLPILMTQTASWVGGFFESPPLAGDPSPAMVAFYALGFILITDFAAYATHWLQHKVPFLWEFHKVHHSAPVMHPLTNFREHPIDNLLYIWVFLVTGGIGIACIAGLMGVDPRSIDFIRTTVFVFIFNFTAYQLRHSHIWLAWPPWLGRIFGSPANHQIHHSCEERHVNKNFGFMFAIWDWIFGTLHLPREREHFRIGLSDGTEAEYDSLARLYGLPFEKVYQMFASKLKRTRGA